MVLLASTLFSDKTDGASRKFEAVDVAIHSPGSRLDILRIQRAGATP
jgi:hypothetical protein